MNTKIADRAAAKLPRWADAFPYVNGGLFSGSMDVPRFSRIARSYLLHIGSLDWTKINPDIFGSMIQAVAEDEERGALGMHYTSVPNILKVLNPLFLDDLRARLEEAGDNPRMLLNLRKRMAKIRVFDPACGSGNFLVIAYKEMRAIEAEINRRRGEAGPAHRNPAHQFSRHRTARLPGRDRAPRAHHRRVSVRRALSRPEGGAGRVPAARRGELDHLRQRPAARLAEHLPADRNRREASTPTTCSTRRSIRRRSTSRTRAGRPISAAIRRIWGQESEIESAKGGHGCCFPELGELQLLDYVAAFIIEAAKFDTDHDAECISIDEFDVSRRTGRDVWPLRLSKALKHICLSIFSNGPISRANNAGVTCVIIGLVRFGGSSKKYSVEGDTVREVETYRPYLMLRPKVIWYEAEYADSVASRMDYG